MCWTYSTDTMVNVQLPITVRDEQYVRYYQNTLYVQTNMCTCPLS